MHDRPSPAQSVLETAGLYNREPLLQNCGQSAYSQLVLQMLFNAPLLRQCWPQGGNAAHGQGATVLS